MPNYGILAVLVGGIIAHVLCIVIASLLGKVIEKCCSERVITFIGGVLFVLFGLLELLKVIDVFPHSWKAIPVLGSFFGENDD